ncbi:hypothetical protein [Paraburkholderia ferrariae]|uniref:hypothetical protein n=1 Tax=Paraburkholderia ferrariae TaxID=386056 RepID=UPI0012EC1AF4|nr:hypothetical protein [Paraburkholderia ferrariae]
MTSHHFNIETTGTADTFAKLAAKGKCGEEAARAVPLAIPLAIPFTAPPATLTRRASRGPRTSRPGCARIPFSNEVRS